MAKKALLQFLEQAIEECWASQRNVDDDSEEFRIIDAQIGAYQDVYKYSNAGEEYDPTADAVDPTEDPIDVPVKKKEVEVVLEDDEDKEDDE